MFRFAARSAIPHGARFQSTASKAVSQASNFITKVQGLVNTSIYWSKVTLELGKYIWVKEGLSPPTVQQFQKFFVQDIKAWFQNAQNISSDPQAIVDKVSGLSRAKVITGGAVVVQLLGLFTLGEIIGRRHVYGYKSYGPKAHAH